MGEFLRYESHGHSNFSDGRESPREIARKSVGKVDIIALSDHNTLQGIPEFLDEVNRIRSEGIMLIPIPSLEISTLFGHMIIAVSDATLFKRFSIWVNKTNLIGAKPESLIVPAVRDFEAICIFTHPEVPGSDGITLSNLQRVLDNLPIDVVHNIGLEVNNNTASFMPWYFLVQRKVKKWNKEYELIEVAGSDFHTMHLIGRLFNQVIQTGDIINLARIFHDKKITPAGRNITPADVLFTFVSHTTGAVRYYRYYRQQKLLSKRE